MEMVRGTDNDGIESFCFFEGSRKSLYGGTAMILAGSAAVWRNRRPRFSDRFAAGNAAGDAERMSQLNGWSGLSQSQPVSREQLRTELQNSWCPIAGNSRWIYWDRKQQRP